MISSRCARCSGTRASIPRRSTRASDRHNSSAAVSFYEERDEDVERVRTCRRSMFEEHSDVPETRGEKLTKAKTKTRSLQSLVHIGGPQSPISNMVEFEVDLI
jgi:hypothetical protein